MSEMCWRVPGTRNNSVALTSNAGRPPRIEESRRRAGAAGGEPEVEPVLPRWGLPSARLDPATSALLVEEPLGGVVDLDLSRLERRGPDRQALASGAHGLLQLVEEDLEAAEALIEEVLGFVTQTA